MESCTTVISVLKVDMYNNSGLRFLDFQLFINKTAQERKSVYALLAQTWL